MVFVDDGVASAFFNEEVVHRERSDEGKEERNRQTSPEQKGMKTGIHRAGNEQHDQIIHDLHHRYRDRVRRKRERQGSPERKLPQERQKRQGVSEDKREQDRDNDSKGVMQAECRADDHARDFTDRTTGQAVHRRAHCHLP